MLLSLMLSFYRVLHAYIQRHVYERSCYCSRRRQQRSSYVKVNQKRLPPKLQYVVAEDACEGGFAAVGRAGDEDFGAYSLFLQRLGLCLVN